MKVLETGRLIVRHFEAEDLEELYRVCSDEEVMRFVGDGRPLSRERVSDWIEKSRENYERYGFGCSAVILKDGGRFIGYCGLVNAKLAEELPEAEVIYGFKQEFWGQGLGGEVASAMIEYGFRDCRLSRIIATIDPQNEASIRIVTRLGLQFHEERLDEHGLPEALFIIDKM